MILPVMDFNQLLYLITELREAQKAYYACPHENKELKRELLGKAKYQEKRIDNYITLMKDNTLFSGAKQESQNTR